MCYTPPTTMGNDTYRWTRGSCSALLRFATRMPMLLGTCSQDASRITAPTTSASCSRAGRLVHPHLQQPGRKARPTLRRPHQRWRLRNRPDERTTARQVAARWAPVPHERDAFGKTWLAFAVIASARLGSETLTWRSRAVRAAGSPIGFGFFYWRFTRYHW
jgi:hypothetical protein